MNEEVLTRRDRRHSWRSRLGDLPLRVTSGLLLGAVALALTAAGPVPFAMLVAVVALLMCWEWGKVVRAGRFDGLLFVHAGAVAAAVVLAISGRPGAAVVVLLVAAAGVLAMALRLGLGGRLVAAGILYVGLPAVALVWLRSSEPMGFAAVLFLFSTVWAADSAAFLGGRLFGGSKLWPSVSPNKTWAGLLSAVLASLVIGAVFGSVLDAGDPALLAPWAACLGFASQGGDLAESALKRLFKVKDASNLIPGHGGFMDRLDGVVAAVAVAALMAVIVDPGAPGRAVLFGA